MRQRYGPWAVVTGASDGIGRAFADCLAEAGVNLVLVARREDVLTELSAALTERNGVETLVVATDLGQPAGIDALTTQTQSLDVGLLVAAA
ncbi:MAG: SDR family NAD(P)-dependent oxidoreductase, partial [Polyangiaceae bacterium]|nr:SDR family NAD(P)-dependent oxidoreductase [Polyangiaceae bacterium]